MKAKYLFVFIVILCGYIYLQHRHGTRLREERDRYRQNNTALLSDMKRIQIDSVRMATDVKGLRLTVEEYKRFRAADAATMERMKVKIRNLEAAARHETELNVKLDATVRDTLIVRDTLMIQAKRVDMVTPYIELRGVIDNHRLQGQIRVPATLHQAVWIEYKRRWIFWKRVKAIHQTIWSDNPYLQIKYSEFIGIE